MKNNIDFAYEYSDLNLLQTRAIVFTGDYAGTIVDFGGSIIGGYSDVEEKKMFFEYTLYKLPNNHDNTINLRGDEKFETFLSELLLNIIDCRKKDLKEKEKVERALMSLNVSKIKIDQGFYLKKTQNNRISSEI